MVVQCAVLRKREYLYSISTAHDGTQRCNTSTHSRWNTYTETWLRIVPSRVSIKPRPLSTAFGTLETVQARFWLWLSFQAKVLQTKLFPFRLTAVRLSSRGEGGRGGELWVLQKESTRGPLRVPVRGQLTGAVDCHRALKSL